MRFTVNCIRMILQRGEQPLGYLQLTRYGELSVDWIAAAWQQDAKNRQERKSDFQSTALEQCASIASTCELEDDGRAMESVLGSPDAAEDVSHRTARPTVIPALQRSLCQLNPYVVYLAQKRTMAYDMYRRDSAS
jgi:hypothetical protein